MLTALRRHKKTVIITFITAIICIYHIAEATQTSVKISKTSTTLIKFPEHIRKAIISDDIPVEIRLEDKEAYLKLDRPYSKIINAFFIGDQNTYSLQLIPGDIKNPVVYAEGPDNKKEKSMEWEKGNVYEEMLAELTKMIYHGRIPPGYKTKIGGKDESPYNEAEMKRELTLTGALYTVTQYKLKNITQGNSRYSEEEFYRSGVVAISIVKHILVPGEETKIYIITKEFK